MTSKKTWLILSAVIGLAGAGCLGSGVVAGHLSAEVFAHEDGSAIALPLGVSLTAEQKHYLWDRDHHGLLPGPEIDDQRLRHELIARGAPAGYTTLRLRLGITGAQSARVTSIAPTDIRRSRVYDGILLDGSYSPHILTYREPHDMYFDLDERSPMARREYTGGGSPPAYFPDKQLVVRSAVMSGKGARHLDARDEFLLMLTIDKGSAEFRLRIEYEVSGDRKWLTIGHRFRLTGFNCVRRGYGLYQHAVIARKTGSGQVLPQDFDSPREAPLTAGCP